MIVQIKFGHQISLMCVYNRGFVYLAVIMDVFTRCVRGWHLSRNLDQDLTLTALKKALKKGKPEIHHSDQGLQYAAREYINTLQNAGVKISMADLGAAWQNGHVERLIRTIKEEEIDLTEYQDYWDAYRQIGKVSRRCLYEQTHPLILGLSDTSRI